MAIIHCQGHQKGADLVAEGNRRANLAARQVANQTPPPPGVDEAITLLVTSYPPEGSPEEQVREFLLFVHRLTHLGV